MMCVIWFVFVRNSLRDFCVISSRTYVYLWLFDEASARDKGHV